MNPDFRRLVFRSSLCTVVRNKTKLVKEEFSFKTLNIKIQVWHFLLNLLQDTLKGDNVTEIRIKFVRKIEDSVPPGDD